MFSERARAYKKLVIENEITRRRHASEISI